MPPAEARHGQQPGHASRRAQSRAGDAPRAGRTLVDLDGRSLRPRLAKHAAPAARVAKRKAGTVARVGIGGLRGGAIDGPRHTLRAIRKNPVKFGLGVVAIGAIGAIGRWAGFDGGMVALGLSALAVAAQVKLSWGNIVRTRGPELARRVGADVLWPAALFFGSWGLGHSIVGDHAAHGGESPTLDDLGESFASSAVIGGDAPAVGVTAFDTFQGNRDPQ